MQHGGEHPPSAQLEDRRALLDVDDRTVLAAVLAVDHARPAGPERLLRARHDPLFGIDDEVGNRPANEFLNLVAEHLRQRVVGFDDHEGVGIDQRDPFRRLLDDGAVADLALAQLGLDALAAVVDAALDLRVPPDQGVEDDDDAEDQQLEPELGGDPPAPLADEAQPPEQQRH